MTEEKKEEIAVIEINEEFMKKKLYEFRGCKVLLDADLAEVYGYELKAFNQQVKRNIERFQNDMMFQLSDEEVKYLRSQFVTANISSKSRSNPYVFTEQGVYMLMTVLKGELAVPWKSFQHLRRYVFCHETSKKVLKMPSNKGILRDLPHLAVSRNPFFRVLTIAS